MAKMTQSKAREIVQSLPNLYPLRDFEEEAILTLLTAKPFDKEEEGEDDRAEILCFCPNCGEYVYNQEDKFCKHCGQPFTDD